MNDQLVKFLFVAGLIVGSCFYSTTSKAVEIQNFRSGLVCEHLANDQETAEWICFDTEIIHITGQGRCVYDAQVEPCTWYGFEFDYDNLSVDETISCVSQSSKSGDIGNPQGIDKYNTRTYKYALDLEPGAGRYYHPQYSLVRRVGNQQKHFEVTEDTICSLGDKELFQYRLRLVFPKSDQN